MPGMPGKQQRTIQTSLVLFVSCQQKRMSSIFSGLFWSTADCLAASGLNTPFNEPLFSFMEPFTCQKLRYCRKFHPQTRHVAWLSAGCVCSTCTDMPGYANILPADKRKSNLSAPINLTVSVLSYLIRPARKINVSKPKSTFHIF